MTRQKPLPLKQVSPNDATLFAQALRIYEESFEARVRLSAEEITHLVARGDYYCMAAVDCNVVTGVAFMAYLSGAHAWHLDYLAIDQDHRGRGTGRRLVSEIIDQDDGMATVRATDWFTLEISDPAALASREEGALESRLVGFYRSAGFALLTNVPYLYPAPGAPDGLPMRLMMRGISSVEPITRDAVLDVIQGVYATIHSVYPPDPLLARVLKAVPQQILTA